MRELKGDWRDLFNGFMVALDLRKCLLAFWGILFSVALCGFSTIQIGRQIADKSPELAGRYVTFPHDLVLHKWWAAQMRSWNVIYEGVVTPGGRVGGEASVYVPYSIGFLLVLAAIWAYFGGAIARIAAYEIAKDGERIETRQAIQFSKKKFWSFFWAPLICAIGFLFFFLCNYFGGLVGKVLDQVVIGAPLVALLLPLALLSGFIMTLIAVGTLAGFPLFAPAVAAEGTDSFDAVSRGFSYVYSRPWHYLGYQLVSAAYGYLCIGFVILFAVALCALGICAGASGFELSGAWDGGQFHDISNASWSLILSEEHRSCDVYKWDPMSIVAAPHPYGRLQVLSNQIVRPDYAGPQAGDLSGGHRFAGFLMTFWLVVTLGIALGYVMSYVISQQTMIYYILRKKVDGIEMNEVFEETEEEAKPAEGEAAKPVEPPKDEKKA